MSEAVKTVTFAGIAVLVAVAAYVSARPTDYSAEEVDETGQQLFADFNDPLKAASLEIIEFDAETATPRAFKVQQVGGRWSIPSHHNYPTDAENQLADAATSVIGLKILNHVSDEASDHELYGVLDPAPDSGSPKAGAKGVGTKVTIADSSGKALADLIIGKEQPDRAENRFVRRSGQNRVYLVKVSTSDLSTKFEDWIEDDLLKTNAWDIKQVLVNNYSVDEVRRRIVPGDQLDLTYDDTATDDKWTLAGLSADEELDTAKLNELRDALDDLKIVDVARKPAGLSAGLKMEENMQIDAEAMVSLQSHGYFIVQGQLLSNEGEVVVRMKDGVEYMLRFGEIANVESGEGADGAEGANRYVFITAAFNPSLIPPPDLEPPPGEQTQPEETPSDTADDAADDANVEDQPDDSGEACQDPRPDVEEIETTDSQNGDADKDAVADEPPVADAAAEAPDEVDLQIQRERIEKANQRKQEEYDQKIADGKQKAEELNARFADWYYVISDEVYRKIRISRSDIINKDDVSLEEFRRLSEEGPEGSQPE